MLGAAIKPPVGTGRWMRAYEEAVRRGKQASATMPFYLTPWEDWLEDPIEEVRDRLGMDPPIEGDADTSTWLTRPIAEKITFGEGSALGPKIRNGKALKEMGVPFRESMEIPISSRKALFSMLENGASV